MTQNEKPREQTGLYGDKPPHVNRQGQPSYAGQLGTRLVVTSSSVIVDRDGEVTLRCMGSCQRILPLRAFGVENVGGELRTLPSCRACR
jgi:hypothetical protein